MERLIIIATRSGCSKATSRAAWPTTALPSSMRTALGVSISPSILGSVTACPRSSSVAIAQKVVPKSMPTNLPAEAAIRVPTHVGRRRVMIVSIVARGEGLMKGGGAEEDQGSRLAEWHGLARLSCTGAFLQPPLPFFLDDRL